MKLALFTDTLDEINGVARFIRDMGEQSLRLGRSLTIHTCSARPRVELPCRKNFKPLISMKMPYYPELPANLPPVTQILSWAEEQKFDAVHCSTPGAMGLCGYLVSRLLGVPMLGTHHTDFPAYLLHLTGWKIMSAGCATYLRWFYGRMSAVFSRSESYHENLMSLGVPRGNLLTIVPGINTEKFNVRHRDDGLWQRLGIAERYKLFYAGRISVEKNLPMLCEIFEQLCRRRSDVALVLAGDGPYFSRMKERLKNTPAYFLGYQNDQQLGPLYATSDLFIFPSCTDTLGQVVMESLSSGLPAIVTNQGGPCGIVQHDQTGLVLPPDRAQAWVDAIDALLNDEPRRLRYSLAAPAPVHAHSLQKTFEHFWHEHALRAGQASAPAPSIALAVNRA
jgi:glycosyltransferase involved in cell wall biosynthesis